MNLAWVQSYLTRLSAYLFELTDNQTFHDASQLSLAFINSHMFDQLAGQIVDSFDLTECKAPDVVYTYEAGLFLEGLSVFGYKTNDTNIIRQYVFLISSSKFWPNSIFHIHVQSWQIRFNRNQIKCMDSQQWSRERDC